MLDESHSLTELLGERSGLICQLSQATADHLRMLQKLSGIEVLLMQTPESAVHLADMASAESERQQIHNKIKQLESRLAIIDRKIEIEMTTETRNVRQSNKRNIAI